MVFIYLRIGFLEQGRKDNVGVPRIRFLHFYCSTWAEWIEERRWLPPRCLTFSSFVRRVEGKPKLFGDRSWSDSGQAPISMGRKQRAIENCIEEFENFKVPCEQAAIALCASAADKLFLRTFTASAVVWAVLSKASLDFSEFIPLDVSWSISSMLLKLFHLMQQFFVLNKIAISGVLYLLSIIIQLVYNTSFDTRKFLSSIEIRHRKAPNQREKIIIDK